MFVAHSLGGLIVKKPLTLSEAARNTSSPRWVSYLFLDSLSKPILIRKEEIPRLLSNPHYLRTRPILWRMLNPSRCVKRLGGILLPLAQIFCTLVMGNYYPPDPEDTTHSPYNSWLKSVQRSERQVSRTLKLFRTQRTTH